jgi:hypothetical protein
MYKSKKYMLNGHFNLQRAVAPDCMGSFKTALISDEYERVK